MANLCLAKEQDFVGTKNRSVVLSVCHTSIFLCYVISNTTPRGSCSGCADAQNRMGCT